MATAQWYSQVNDHVRFGSKADMCGATRDVRFTPESGHSRRKSTRMTFSETTAVGHPDDKAGTGQNLATPTIPQSGRPGRRAWFSRHQALARAWSVAQAGTRRIQPSACDATLVFFFFLSLAATFVFFLPVSANCVGLLALLACCT